jgi:hypothetical protein
VYWLSLLLLLLLSPLLLLLQVSELDAVQQQVPPPAPTPVDSRLFEQLCSTPPLQVSNRVQHTPPEIATWSIFLCCEPRPDPDDVTPTVMSQVRTCTNWMGLCCV